MRPQMEDKSMKKMMGYYTGRDWTSSVRPEYEGDEVTDNLGALDAPETVPAGSTEQRTGLTGESFAWPRAAFRPWF